MKIIAINREMFYSQPTKAWSEITAALNANIDSPIFIDRERANINNTTQTTFPDITPLSLGRLLNKQSLLNTLSCYKIFSETQNGMLCLDLRGLTGEEIYTNAHILAKTAFNLKNRPKIYLLLVEGSMSVHFVELWHNAFYIEPFPLHHLSAHLDQIISRMRRSATVQRYFGIRVTNILRRFWHFSAKFRRK